MEKSHRVKLLVDVIYSSNIHYAFTLPPIHLPPKISESERVEFYEERNSMLSQHGLSDCEKTKIDESKYTVFLPKRSESHSIALYGTTWEELAHVAAYALGFRDRSLNEGFALAYRFKGLLLGAKDGLFSIDQALDEIQRTLNPFIAKKAMLAALRKCFPNMKVHTTEHYEKALSIIEKNNPNLRFRNRNPDDLLVELDKSINHALWIHRKQILKEIVIDTIKSFLVG